MNDKIVALKAPSQSLYRSSRRGESNSQRKGQSKTHRNHQPEFTGKTPRGMASVVVGCIRNHDWCRNPDLIELRRQGYTPYSRIFDRTFRPRPMRITARSESREALSALSLVLAANCDYSPDSEYMFEIMLPVEEMARRMGVLHVYESGRKAYDVLLNALRVLEQLDYVVIHRDRDADCGQNKPMRIFLTDTFFTSRGMSIETVRQSLHKYRQWAVASGVAESMKEKHERHQLKMARLGINIDNHHSLKNRLKKIKRWVVSPDLREEKRRVTSDIEVALDGHSQKLRQLRPRGGADRNAGSVMAPAVWFAYSPDRKGVHPQTHLAEFSGVLQADAYAGFNELYREGQIKEAACWAHARRKIHDVHVRTPSETTTEALRRIGELYGIEAGIRGKSAAERLATRQEKTVPLLNALEGWLREKQQSLSRHSELAKAFTYALNQWEALKYYASDGWAEPDNNLAENALRTVSLGRKNYLFFGSDHGGNRGAQLYGLIGSCRLNGVEPEHYLRHVLSVIADWPVNRVGELLPWRVTLPGE